MVRKKLKSSRHRANKAEVLERDGNFCWYCDEEFQEGETSTLDHFWPDWFCQLMEIPTWIREHPENKRLSCEPCNNKKADTLPDSYQDFLDWVQYMIDTYPERNTLYEGNDFARDSRQRQEHAS